MPFDMPLIELLRQASDRVLLRVVDSPGARVVHQFTGKDLLESQATARLQPIAKDSRIVLLLLPHCPELFLLQIGLTLSGKVPAILPWPTTQVDRAEVSTQSIASIVPTSRPSLDYLTCASPTLAAISRLFSFRDCNPQCRLNSRVDFVSVSPQRVRILTRLA